MSASRYRVKSLESTINYCCFLEIVALFAAVTPLGLDSYQLLREFLPRSLAIFRGAGLLVEVDSFPALSD